MTPASGGITWYKWNYGLGAISKINQLLALIPNVNFSAGMAPKWEAELKYLRGFLYADMADLYGGMPLITEPIDPTEADAITRSTEAETYAQAISDLDFAIANLDTKPNNGDYGRPTKQAALMAKGLAELNQKKFSESAATLGQLVALEGADVGLVDNDVWEGLNRGTQETSKEIIWSMKAGPGNEGTGDYIPYGVAGDGDYNGWSGIKFTQDGVDAFEMQATGLPITDPASGYDADNPLEGRDPRLRKTFYFEGDEYWGGTIGDVQFGAVCCNGNLKAQSSVGIAPVFPRKTTTYTQEQKAQMATIEYGSPIDLNLFRYADALLLYAEALNEGGQTAQALAPLNQVRTRATMPAIAAGLSQAEMRAKILHERRVELYLEGKRYFDLRRQGMLMETINNNQGWDLHGGANYKSHYDLWPIPSETTDNNPNISQNPGY
jgi:tetratricopeptide (TPR) repeat protein